MELVGTGRVRLTGLLQPGVQAPELASLWGHQSWNAISRGVVTPAGQNVVMFFVTKEKQQTLTQYQDHFDGDQLHWEGETNHGNDTRIVHAESVGDETQLFYR